MLQCAYYLVLNANVKGFLNISLLCFKLSWTSDVEQQHFIVKYV